MLVITCATCSSHYELAQHAAAANTKSPCMAAQGTLHECSCILTCDLCTLRCMRLPDLTSTLPVLPSHLLRHVSTATACRGEPCQDIAFAIGDSCVPTRGEQPSLPGTDQFSCTCFDNYRWAGRVLQQQPEVLCRRLCGAAAGAPHTCRCS
jgi:hypothetical protein